MMISGPLFSAIIIECIGVLTWGLYYSRGILSELGVFFFCNYGWYQCGVVSWSYLLGVYHDYCILIPADFPSLLSAPHFVLVSVSL